MFEKKLIEHCAPTLASLKTASLFCIACTDRTALIRCAAHWNRQMRAKGISITILRITPDSALVYVYRARQLEKDLGNPGVAGFLKSCGYESMNLSELLKHLRRRLRSSDSFPHEIGLFLGYPLGDVTGFIENAGKNYAYKGYWKVYSNAGETVRTFEKFRKCKSVYERLWKEGRSVWQLTVAA